jgi:hypothetical protein
MQTCKCRDHPTYETCSCRPGLKGERNGDSPAPWKPTPVGTWLLIRYDHADYGVRPIPNSVDSWWESPDIWITGGDSDGNPIVGKRATLHARIWNLGELHALPVAVTFAIIEPSLGIPASAPETIGTVGAHVPAKGFREVTIDWNVPVINGNVHACILVTCASPLNGDVPSMPGNPVTNRQTGQHNITIIGAPSEQVDFHLSLVNLRPWTAEVEVSAHAAWRRATAVGTAWSSIVANGRAGYR